VQAEAPIASAPPHEAASSEAKVQITAAPPREAARRPAGEALGADSPLYAFCSAIRTVPAPPRRGLALRALTSLVSPLPDMALRLPSAAFAAALRAWLAAEDFDIIQVEGIEMAAYGLQARRAGTRLVFDDHNAEYVLQRSAFQSDARRPSRWHAALYSFVQWQKLARYERHVLWNHDAVAAVSQTDARALQKIAPGLTVHVVPNGVDTEEFAPAGPPQIDGVPDPQATPSDRPLLSHDTAEGQGLSADLVFTGKMDYRPNVDAVLWFAAEILPRVRAQVPAARFVIVGQQPHARLAPLAALAGVLLTGWVEDVRPYIAGAAVYVAPLRMGGGTRLKVLQAMSMAKPIVSTTLGCDGLSVQSGREALLADTPDAFAAAVVRLLRDPALGRQLGTQARELAIAQYDWRRIGPLMEACYAA
jgi:polysaccharide biosynthesis protein PslH